MLSRTKIIVGIVSLTLLVIAITMVNSLKIAPPIQGANPTSDSASFVSLEDAQSMLQLWIAYSNAANKDITGSIENDFPKGLPVMIKAAIFRYEPSHHQLLVSGLVGYQADMLSLYPELWQKLVRVGQREYTTMMYGEAQFELLRQPLFDLKPDVVLLTKPYTERLTDGRKLGAQITWLLLDADYWFVNRYNEVMGKTEEELIAEAPGINEWMLKERPKSW